MMKLSKQIGKVLIDYEKDINLEKMNGKKAVILIMAVNDVESITINEIIKALNHFSIEKQQINSYLKSNGFTNLKFNI